MCVGQGVAFAALHFEFGRFARGYRGNGSPLSSLERQDLAARVPATQPKSQQERTMSLLAIPGAISAVISGLSSHVHKKGGHGGDNSALGSISSTGTSTTKTSSTDSSKRSASGSHSLFGSIMDAANSANAISTANAGKPGPAAVITAARAALQKA